MQNNEQNPIITPTQEQNSIPVVKRTREEMIKKTAILFGIFVLLVVAIGFTVVLVPRGLSSLASVSLSSIFKPSEKMVIQADKTTINSGDTVTLSWNGSIQNDGAYSISYPCKSGVTAQFHSGENITCNQPFFFTSSDNTASIIIASTNSENTDVPLYVNFKDTEGNSSDIGTSLITVQSASNPVAVVTSTSTTTSPATTTVSTPKPVTSTDTTVPSYTTPKPVVVSNNTYTSPVVNGPIDLAIRVVAIGSLDNANNFTPGLAIPVGSRPAVRFAVKNIGQGISGAWTFKAILTSPTDPVYQSAPQASLAHNDEIDFTLGFDNSSTGGQITISVNDNRAVKESNYLNNIITYKISGNTTATKNVTVTSTSIGKDLSVNIDSVSKASSTHATVYFTVSNIGTVDSGSFIWNAILPGNTTATYTSETQPSIAAGSSVKFAMNLDYTSTSNNTVTITVDPNRTLGESNTGNNTASINIPN